MSTPDRRGMLDPSHESLSVRRQCELVGVARSGVYPARPSAGDAGLAVMKRLDPLYTERPFHSSRRMTLQLRHKTNHKRVQRLMRRMGIVALGPKPNTSKSTPGRKIHPYLLGDLNIERPNHIWCTDITYLPIGDGFLYLVAVMDWASRAVPSWRLSNTMDAAFCVAALDDPLARYGRPEIFNTVERLWRSLKHEDVSLKAYADGREAGAGIAAWITFDNTERFHQALGNLTPTRVWREAMVVAAASGAGPVKMMDNAAALTTSPQRQQTTASLAA